jgi:hypothetical protein
MRASRVTIPATRPCSSHSQVYRARLAATGQEVAVKVQRPNALATISKDLYVMRRAVGVYERIVRRFTAQTTDYQSLLSTFAEGLYTEMDFRNEALNAQLMASLLAGRLGPGRGRIWGWENPLIKGVVVGGEEGAGSREGTPGAGTVLSRISAALSVYKQLLDAPWRCRLLLHHCLPASAALIPWLAD